MRKYLRVANWLSLILFGVVALGLALAQPYAATPAAANILPFGAALIAVREGSQRSSIWVAAVLNVVWSALLLVGAFTLALGLAAATSVAFGALLATISTFCALNAIHMWRLLREAA